MALRRQRRRVPAARERLLDVLQTVGQLCHFEPNLHALIDWWNLKRPGTRPGTDGHRDCEDRRAAEPGKELRNAGPARPCLVLAQGVEGTLLQRLQPRLRGWRERLESL